MSRILEILKNAVSLGSSDIHLKTGKKPWFRTNGKLGVPESEAVTAQEMAEFLKLALPSCPDGLVRDRDFLVSSACSGDLRFRANAAVSEGVQEIVLRALPTKIPDLSILGLPDKFIDLLSSEKGLILVTGATGSGKSTTLASIIQKVCCNPHHQKIITLEDPIEYQLSSDNTLITQREVGSDVLNFPTGLKSAMRQDPDVIMVGETRDKETADLILTAAETGHLVFSSLHTPSAIGTADRLINMFEGNKLDISARLASNLLAIVSQTLLPRADGQGRVMAAEVLIATHAVKHILRNGEPHRLVNEFRKQDGSISMEMRLRELQSEGLISRATYEETIKNFTSQGRTR